MLLQQFLPFTVLKPSYHDMEEDAIKVATVLTVYGIETDIIRSAIWYLHW